MSAALPPAQYLVGLTVVLDHLLNEVLGPAIRVGTVADRVLLVYGQKHRVSVHSGRAAEHQIVHPVCLHHLQCIRLHTIMVHRQHYRGLVGRQLIKPQTRLE